MKQLSLIVSSVCALVMSNAAFAAPSSALHSKMLVVKQTAMGDHTLQYQRGNNDLYTAVPLGAAGDNGKNQTTAAVVIPSAHSLNGVTSVTNQFGMMPIASAPTSFFQVRRFDYEEFWKRMNAVQLCEDGIYQQVTSGAASCNPETSDCSNMSNDMYSSNPVSPKQLANMAMGYDPANLGSWSGTIASYKAAVPACNAGTWSDYAQAVRVREGLIDKYNDAMAHCTGSASECQTINPMPDYTQDSEAVIELVTADYIRHNRYSGINQLRQGIVQYLKDHDIEAAWLDIEFQYKMADPEKKPEARRVALSFQINKNDGFADAPSDTDSKGSYLGSALIPAPDTAPSDVQTRTNHLVLSYAVATQHPDFYNAVSQNFQTLRALEAVPKAASPRGGSPSHPTYAGVMYWDVYAKVNGATDSLASPPTSPVSSKLCISIPGSARVGACSGEHGAMYLAYGAYDPEKTHIDGSDGEGSPPQDVPHPVTGLPVTTILTPDPTQLKNGMECFFTGTSQYPARCMKEIHNAASLMNATNSATGELSYYGRWELDPKNMESNPTDPYPKINEIGRAMVYEVCGDVEFRNNIEVQYMVRRTKHTANFAMDEQGGLSYQITGVKYENDGIVLPRFVPYSTGSSVPFRQNNTFARPKGPLANPDSSVANAYAAHYNAPYDPPYPTPPSPNVNVYNAPPGEGSIILNPFVTDNRNSGVLSNNYNIYRKIPGLVADDSTLEKNMVGTPIYKAVPYPATKSSSLPGTWPNGGGGHGFNTDPVDNPQQRYGDFNCWNVNEQHWALHQTPLGSIVNGWKYYEVDPNPIHPYDSGIPSNVYFAGSGGEAAAHQRGTRPNYGDYWHVGNGSDNNFLGVDCEVSWAYTQDYTWTKEYGEATDTCDAELSSTGSCSPPRYPPAICSAGPDKDGKMPDLTNVDCADHPTVTKERWIRWWSWVPLGTLQHDYNTQRSCFESCQYDPNAYGYGKGVGICNSARLYQRY